ncbi:MAG: MBL fold metallo-hydrolase, partial [Rhizobiales bacterium]|nr:MBL fold metallo-hydrolase [Hyphomicrobiales bacterium]
DENLYLGEMPIEIIPTPGHTPACVSYKIEDSIWVGDTLFMPDFGTARCDFPGGDAASLYDSIQLILAHPKHTKLYMCHDYKSEKRQQFEWETTVDEQQKHNIHINSSVSKTTFIKTRTTRDATLKTPKLLLPAIQLNINAGFLPKTEANGVSYIKIPINIQ